MSFTSNLARLTGGRRHVLLAHTRCANVALLVIEVKKVDQNRKNLSVSRTVTGSHANRIHCHPDQLKGKIPHSNASICVDLPVAHKSRSGSCSSEPGTAP
jgi:hypothetical protein